MEILQESQQLVLVSPQNRRNLRRLVWIRDKHLPSAPPHQPTALETHLENMKRLELDIPALIPEEVHHHLEITLVRDILRHDTIICSVE
jgi:hypothetical protein